MKLEVAVVPVADVSDVFHDAGGVFHAGTQGQVLGPAPDHKSYGPFVSFSDPDGTGWLSRKSPTACRAGNADAGLGTGT